MADGLGWLKPQADYEKIVRFVWKQLGAERTNNLAQVVSDALPFREAFNILRKALAKQGAGPKANIMQALAATKQPRAVQLVRKQVQKALGHSELMADCEFVNWGRL